MHVDNYLRWGFIFGGKGNGIFLRETFSVLSRNHRKIRNISNLPPSNNHCKIFDEVARNNCFLLFIAGKSFIWVITQTFLNRKRFPLKNKKKYLCYWRFADLLGLKICHFLFKAKNQLEASWAGVSPLYLEHFVEITSTGRHLIKKGFETSSKWMWNILRGAFQMIPETQIKDYPEIIKRKSTNIEMNWNDGNVMEMIFAWENLHR